MNKENIKPLLTAGLLLGIGLGGFIDGILFHQIMQIHNMLSNLYFPDTLVNLEINMFWDGLFHAFTWLTTVIGIIFLWNAMKKENVPKSNKLLFGSMLLGFGLFNIVEGSINHLILQLHHVVQRANSPSQFYFDIAFLLSGIFLLWLGSNFIKR